MRCCVNSSCFVVKISVVSARMPWMPTIRTDTMSHIDDVDFHTCTENAFLGLFPSPRDDRKARKLLPNIVFLIILALNAACQARIAELKRVDTAVIGRSITLSNMATAIGSGARRAQWRTRKLSENEILAMYKYRNHRVIVDIVFSSDKYSIVYRNSLNMKVVCSADSPVLAQSVAHRVVTNGVDPCPNGAIPEYIHEKYNEWVKQLDQKIYGAILANDF